MPIHLYILNVIHSNLYCSIVTIIGWILQICAQIFWSSRQIRKIHHFSMSNNIPLFDVAVIIYSCPNPMLMQLQYIPRNMHTVFALLCFVVVIHGLIFPYPSGLLHWHCGNLTIVPVPAKQPWWIWINTSCEFIMNDCITTTKQSTTKPCAYFLGCTVKRICEIPVLRVVLSWISLYQNMDK